MVAAPLIFISTLMAVFDATLFAFLYRDWRLWLSSRNADVCGRSHDRFDEAAQIPLNLLNVLAFRLVLAIGVDYGIYVLLVWQRAAIRARCYRSGETGDLAGLTAIAGFGSLGWP